MGKWLAIAGVALLVLLIVLWRSMDNSAATPQSITGVVTPQPAKSTTTDRVVKPAASEAKVEPEKPKQLDHMSDEFFYRFTERVPKRLTAEAVECYNHRTGSLHRNAKLVLVFTVQVRKGHVTVHNVKIKPPDEDDPDQQNNTLADPALESCFIQKVSRATWTDTELPDYDWPDELVLRPERGMKGYWKSNQDYEGAEAPKKDFSVHPSPKQ